MRRFRSLSSIVAAGAIVALGVVVMPVAPAGAATRAVAPHATTVTHTYHVTTTTDADLNGSAPASTCQDVGDTAQCSLRAAVAVANNDMLANSGVWDVIDLPAGTYDLESLVDASSLQLLHQGSLSVVGAGASSTVIDESGESTSANPAFTLAAADDFNLQGVTIRNVSGVADGGAIYLANGSMAAITNCAFSHDVATTTGGAIYVTSNSAATITSSTFTSDSAAHIGGAIDNESNSPLVLANDTFSDNATTGASNNSYEGGAVLSAGALTVTGTTFSDNTGSGHGGAVFAVGDGYFSKDTFTGNSSGNSNGGALYIYDMGVVVNSTFTSNTSSGGQGGAIFDDGILRADHDTFTGNTSEQGGDIYDFYNTNATNSTFQNSTAYNGGGSIAVGTNSSLELTSDSVKGSSSLGGGGGALYMDNMTYGAFTAVTFQNNVATANPESGGGLFCNNCQLTVDSSSFQGNSTSSSGGAVFVEQGGEVVMSSSTVTGNRAGLYGGGLADYGGGYLELSGTTVAQNTATADGGGGVFVDDNSDFFITSSTVAHNTAVGTSGFGGGLDVGADGDTTGSHGNVVDSTIADNQAVSGGGIFTFDSLLGLASTTVASNSLTTGASGSNGGGVYADGTPVQASDSIFAGNGGNQCGGVAIAFSGGDNLASDFSCGLTAAGDIVNATPNLLPLGNYGGPTQTLLPLGTSPAVGHGGPVCAGVDQRGVAVPTGAPCTIGADFAEAATLALSASKSTIVKGKEQLETFTLTVKPKGNATKPTGKVDVYYGTKVVCVATVVVHTGTTAIGTCTLAPSALSIGTRSLSATYLPAGILSGAISNTVKVRVT